MYPVYFGIIPSCKYNLLLNAAGALFKCSRDTLKSTISSSNNIHITYLINRGSYMSAHVLLNLLNELGKRDKMRGLPSILSLFRNEFNKFNNTRA